MLAQSFKTAEELGLTTDQVEGLIKTLKVLETDKTQHQPLREFSGVFFFDTEQYRFDGLFNMAVWAGDQPECGTIRCIGGTAEALMGKKLFDLVSIGRNENQEELYDLFCPKARHLQGRPNWSEITPSQAATALRSYLTTGQANWDAALA